MMNLARTRRKENASFRPPRSDSLSARNQESSKVPRRDQRTPLGVPILPLHFHSIKDRLAGEGTEAASQERRSSLHSCGVALMDWPIRSRFRQLRQRSAGEWAEWRTQWTVHASVAGTGTKVRFCLEIG